MRVGGTVLHTLAGNQLAGAVLGYAATTTVCPMTSLPGKPSKTRTLPNRADDNRFQP